MIIRGIVAAVRRFDMRYGNRCIAVVAVLAFGGFLVMLAAALWFERNARRLGKAGVDQLTQSMRAKGIKDYFGSTGERMRERFQRDE